MRRGLAWLVVAAALVCAKWPTRAEPAYWDGFAYIEQVQQIFDRGWHLQAYRDVQFLRPPLYAGSIALGMKGLGASLWVAHAITWLWAFAALPAVWLLARRLGAQARVAWLAVGLFAVTPLFFAQSGQLLSDLPVTALIAFAWAALLGGSRTRFVLLAGLAVLCKEVAFFLCVPAFALELWRARGGGPVRALVRAAPVVLPAAVLAVWIVVQHALTGTWLFQGSKEAIGLRWLHLALYRNFVDGGRILYWPAALLAVGGARDEQGARRIATLAAAAFLPFAFPAPLPRYMLPSLPLVCALAAIGLERLPARWRIASVGTLVAAQVALWFAPIDGRAGADLDASLGYRRILSAHAPAFAAIAAARPRGVIAGFPAYNALTVPLAGYVDARLAVQLARAGASLDELCANDLLVETALGSPVDSIRERLLEAGALQPWQSFGQGPSAVTLWHVACPGRMRR